MAITFTLGSSSFSAIDGTTNTRMALDIQVGAAKIHMVRHHIPGVDGNIVVRGGKMGRDIVAIVRYRGDSQNSCIKLFENDKQAWQNAAIDIVDDIGTTYNNCNLLMARKIKRPHPTGRADNQTQMDVEYTFTQDGALETEA